MNVRRCIFILADGARADVFNYLLKRGDLPNIAKYILEEGSYHDAVSVFPSTTGPAYTPYLLGKFPGRCNLPGIRWFDKTSFSSNALSLRSFRSYVGPETFFINSDLDTNGIPTLFETIPRSASILNEITRGIKNGEDKTRFIKAFYKMKSHFTDGTNEVDSAAGKMLLQSIKKDDPSFIFCVFLGIDTYSHQYHPYHKKVLESYRLIDKYIGLAGEFLTKEDKLENTLMIIGSDHGLTPTHSHFDLLNFIKGKGYKTLHYPNIFNHIHDADASCMVSGNAMAHLYFKNCSNWESNTSINELETVVSDLLENPAIDLVFGKNEQGEIVIRSEKGEASTKIENSHVYYKVNSDDPFGFSKMPEIFDFDFLLEETINTNYPDALVQINQLFDSRRTGDLVVSASPGFDLRANFEKPEHCSSHGSLIRDHMIVPLLFSKKTTEKYVRTTDVYPTVLNYLGYPIYENIDGKNLI